MQNIAANAPNTDVERSQNIPHDLSNLGYLQSSATTEKRRPTPTSGGWPFSVKSCDTVDLFGLNYFEVKFMISPTYMEIS